MVDAQANEVFAIDASTGTIDAASIQGLNKNGEAFDLSDASDIAFRANGTAQETRCLPTSPCFQRRCLLQQASVIAWLDFNVDHVANKPEAPSWRESSKLPAKPARSHGALRWSSWISHIESLLKFD